MYQMPGSSINPCLNKVPKLGEGCFLATGAHLIGDLVVGSNTSFWFNTVVRADCNDIRIGDETNVQDGTVIHVTGGTGPTRIGSKVTIGHSAVIHACTIDDLCLIGMGAIILDGAKISSQTVVAAGSVIPPGKTYPSGVLIMGSPAKVIRNLTLREIEFFVESASSYIGYKNNMIASALR